jgi:glycosyltransferase involved in cell wall biosynthesis
VNIANPGPANLVSVVIPVFNGEKYLAEAIASVFGQSHQPMEVIVVDDGSTDNSAAVARGFSGITYCFQENAGLSSALNRGIGMANGDYLAFLDADDLWTAGKLDQQMNCLRHDPSLDMVFSHVRQFYSPELKDGNAQSIPAALRVIPGFCAGTMLIRRPAFSRAGLFNPKLKLGHFLAWYMHAQDNGLRGRMLAEVMLKRRWHAANMGIVMREARSEYARILKASLDSRRRHSADGRAEKIDGEPTLG